MPCWLRQQLLASPGAWHQGLCDQVLVELLALCPSVLFQCLGQVPKLLVTVADASLPSLPAHPLGLGVLCSSLLLLSAPDHQKFAVLRVEIVRVES